ncbi:SpaH/EbpB family LPXTG-anchored major pilin [Microbacterium excoecariae]|uniref:SpaH/EbpB family LPXTG-anchored major pilin n=1 Tax=Microbacterium excoecariae TaxID=2715210 RepID=UPI0014088E04|nr:SpaH/EbpB family LPXTG-anchored major pilin [Microbacterium excoecariae]NHI17728.1 SpaH/EbpB family LPXTG-anchored major pilin [Microbacterium excoecariae]
MSEKSLARGAWRALAGVTATAVLALAAGPAFAAGPGNIDPEAEPTLTIHKYEQPDGTLGENDGTEIDVPADANALEGVEFTVQRLGSVDLLTNAGWDTLDGLTAADVLADPDAYGLEAGVAETTDAEGIATFAAPDVEIGAYLVTETAAGPNPIVQPAVPFLVTLPMPAGDGAWNYAPHVYPKNALSSITKAVDDTSAVVLGDIVDWTITSAVPLLPEGTTYTDYTVTDTLDARLGFSAATVSLGGTALVEGTDYTLTAPAVGENGTVTIQVDPAVANAAGAGAELVVVLSTEVLSIGDGVIPNTATVFINDPERTNGTESNEVDTKWGALQIVKHAAGDETQLLEGAAFDVYAVDPAQNADAEPVASLETDEAGQATVSLATGQADSRDYWLVETAAPAGYELDETPIQVTVVAGSVANATVELIANSQVPAFMLPMTGGMGASPIVLGGLGMLLLAAGAYLIVRRRARVAEQAA